MTTNTSSSARNSNPYDERNTADKRNDHLTVGWAEHGIQGPAAAIALQPHAMTLWSQFLQEYSRCENTTKGDDKSCHLSSDFKRAHLSQFLHAVGMSE